jgi:hypothetical protein
MNRNLILVIAASLIVSISHARADVVTDWNATIQDVMQAVPAKANPGLATRAAAMMNGAIYDVFQAFDRTHQPLVVRNLSPAAGANLDAAVARAAHDILADCYGEAAAIWGPAYTSRLAAIVDSQANKDAGEALGTLIAQKYIQKRTGDHSGDMVPYTGPGGMGHWAPDALHPTQEAWGPGWGTVHTWALPNSDYVDVPGPPALDSDTYRDAYNMVKDWGALVSPSRTLNPDATAIGLFWAYDRASMGPPPVLFVRNLVDIAGQTPNNTPADNARLFAMASVAMADAAVAAWDVKFEDDFWRPITGIRAGDSDPNLETVGDSNWVPLGAPGNDPLDPNDPTPGVEDDFTPPFPAYTSGHATMGGALFKTIELFYGTNDFGSIPGVVGSTFLLNSAEAGGGGVRMYDKFSQYPALAPGNEDSPDGENGMSRIYLGVHWIFDQQDGMDLGHAIASYVAQNRFLAVPEPNSFVMSLIAFGVAGLSRRRRCEP